MSAIKGVDCTLQFGIYSFVITIIFYSLQNQDEVTRKNAMDSRSGSVVTAGDEQYNDIPKRKPFHYNSLRDQLQTSHDRDMAAKYHRYRYISKLSGHSVVRNTNTSIVSLV